MKGAGTGSEAEVKAALEKERGLEVLVTTIALVTCLG